MSKVRPSVAPPWGTDDVHIAPAPFPTDNVNKFTARRFTSNVPLSTGHPGDFQTWTSGSHHNIENAWKLRNAPLPAIYGGLDASTNDETKGARDAVAFQLARRKTPSLEANPYEGALGPSLLESRQTVSSHSRSNVNKLVSTPPEVWKRGKAPSQPISGPPPGSNTANRAKLHTPSHLRGRPKVSFESDDSDQEASERRMQRPANTRAKDTSAIPTPVAKEPINARSKSAAPVLETYPQTSPDDTFEQVERKVRQDAIRKEQEKETLRSTLEALNIEFAQANDAEQELHDFTSRLEARISHCDHMMPEVKKTRTALEEVIRRLNIVNKGLNYRLSQSKEELRIFQVESRQLVVAGKEIEISKDVSTEACEAFKAAMEHERQKRLISLMRLQGEVEQSLKDTNQRATQLKSVKEIQDYEQAEMEAEEELARIRSSEDGRDFTVHLKEIRARRHANQASEFEIIAVDPAKEACINRILQAARVGTIEAAIRFYLTCKERFKSLSALKADLEERTAHMRHELTVKSSQLVKMRFLPAPTEIAPAASAVVSENTEEMEKSIGDIAAYAESSRVVCEVMGKIFVEFEEWAVKVLQRFVRVSRDDVFLKQVWRLARHKPEPTTEFEECEAWQQEVLALLTEAMVQQTTFLQQNEEMLRLDQGSDSVPHGPGGGGSTYTISSITGSHKLVAARDSEPSGRMVQLDPSPHRGFDAAGVLSRKG